MEEESRVCLRSPGKNKKFLIEKLGFFMYVERMMRWVLLVFLKSQPKVRDQWSMVKDAESGIDFLCQLKGRAAVSVVDGADKSLCVCMLERWYANLISSDFLCCLFAVSRENFPVRFRRLVGCLFRWLKLGSKKGNLEFEEY